MLVLAALAFILDGLSDVNNNENKAIEYAYSNNDKTPSQQAFRCPDALLGCQPLRGHWGQAKGSLGANSRKCLAVAPCESLPVAGHC